MSEHKLLVKQKLPTSHKPHTHNPRGPRTDPTGRAPFSLYNRSYTAPLINLEFCEDDCLKPPAYFYSSC